MPLTRLTPHLFRVPLAEPVVTSFGTMRARWALWVSLEDADGARGWGEVWCNFPDSGALHRARLLQEVFAPLLPALPSADPLQAARQMTASTRILRLQSGEFGPLDQCLAGLDTALWDLHARRLGQPLHRVLRQALGQPPAPDGAEDRVRAYASGINPQGAADTLRRAAAQGHRAFKVKIGFGAAQDLRTLEESRACAGASAWLAADANQAWSRAEAMAMLPRLACFGLAWLEEPLAADAGTADWQALSRGAPMPLAAGENIHQLDGFEEALAQWGLGAMQPDLAKWGGPSGCLEVVRRCRHHGVLYCPHYLGGAIGLLASAHLLAASGSGGLLEMDVNPNPLRTVPLAGALQPEEGWVTLPPGPGIGIEPDLATLQAWRQPNPA